MPEPELELEPEPVPEPELEPEPEPVPEPELEPELLLEPEPEPLPEQAAEPVSRNRNKSHAYLSYPREPVWPCRKLLDCLAQTDRLRTYRL